MRVVAVLFDLSLSLNKLAQLELEELYTRILRHGWLYSLSWSKRACNIVPKSVISVKTVKF